MCQYKYQRLPMVYACASRTSKIFVVGLKTERVLKLKRNDDDAGAGQRGNIIIRARVHIAVTVRSSRG